MVSKESIKYCECGCGQVVKPGNRFIHTHHSRGHKHTEASKKLMSICKTKQRFPIQLVLCACGCGQQTNTVNGIPNKYIRGHHRTGKHLSEEHRDAISRGNLGNVFSEEHRHNLSKSKIGTQTGDKNPMFGRNHTEESKRKMSKTRMGKPDAGRKKIKQIYLYLDYDCETDNEVVWRQKIDHNGKLQGIGCFLMRHPGSGSIEDRRRWSVESNAKCRGLGSRRISLEHRGCQWHHVTRECIVAMSTHIHSKISHKLGENKLEGVIG